MNCESARQRLLALIEGDPPLPPAEREATKAHLADCPACRAEAEALREQVALLRGAGEWARSLGGSLLPAGACRTGKTPGRLRRAGGRSERSRQNSAGLVYWLSAAAAVLLIGFLAWKHLGSPGKPGSTGSDGRPAENLQAHLLSGEVLRNGQPVGIMLPGRRYVVSPAGDAEIELPSEKSRARILSGSHFGIPSDYESRPGLDLISGRMRCFSDSPLHVRGQRLTAVACGEFAVATRASPPPPAGKGAASFLQDWLFPVAYAAEDPAPGAEAPEVFLLESGWADLTLAGKRFTLRTREAVIGGDGSEPLRGDPGTLLRELRSEQRRLLAGLLSPTYRAVIADYTARRARYLEELGKPATSPERRRALGWKLELLKNLLEAHAGRLSSLAREEAPALRRAQVLDARIELLLELLNGHKTPASPTTVVEPAPPKCAVGRVAHRGRPRNARAR